MLFSSVCIAFNYIGFFIMAFNAEYTFKSVWTTFKKRLINLLLSYLHSKVYLYIEIVENQTI